MSCSPSKNGDEQSPLLRAYLAIEALEKQLEATRRAGSEPIAIVGMACRFPGGVADPEAFWRLMRDGIDAVTEVPPSRWDVDAYYDPDPDAAGKMYTRHMSYVHDIDRFDAPFFGIAPREAITMDPQQRLMLEVAWEALEHAGQAPDKLAGTNTGVFMGVGHNDHSRLMIKFDDPASVELHTGSGSACSIATGRIAYTLGLRGPTMSVDTACSSALVVTHLACQALRAGECDVALAGGVNIVLSPISTIIACKMRMLSSDGHCKTFDASANGFVRGEGCGIVVLKRLSDAIKNRDRILALIRGSAVNQDGRSTGLTVPNGPAQEVLIRRALAVAGVEPADVDYIEAHGTGTSLGDPIELQALGSVFCQHRSKDKPLLVGSVKTNIGHLETAAGAAGLIKVILAMQHGEIPRHLHFETPNPLIDWDAWPITVPTESVPWPAGQQPRRAGVSSFGFSGTNAHLVVEEAPEIEIPAAEVDRPVHVLALSAKTEPALRDMAGRYADYFAANPDACLADVGFTANAGRSHFAHRLAMVAGSAAELQGRLAAFAAGEKASDLVEGHCPVGHRPKVAFLFTGQGSQYAGMARELYETQPTFRKILDECDAYLRPHLDRPLLALLFDNDAEQHLRETVYQQPALFALEYALASLWRAWGVEPAACLGHSIGEVAAACFAGVFTLADGLELIAARARLMHGCPGSGAMASVFADADRVEAAIRGQSGAVTIAAYNGPEHTVISGAPKAVEAVLAALAADGVRAQALPVSHAFHSALMEPMLGEFERIVAKVTYRPAEVSLISNVTGKLAADDEIGSAAYWCDHIRRPVRFLDGMRALVDEGTGLFLEVGPGATLLGMGRQCVDRGGRVWLNSLRKGQSDWKQMLQSLTRLYTQGVDIDWAGFDSDYPRRRLALPTYPFQSEQYWMEASEARRKAGLQTSPTSRRVLHPLLGCRLRSALRDVQFESALTATSPEFLTDHRVHGMVILAGAAYLEMALAAGAETQGDGPLVVEDVSINEPLVFEADAVRTVQSILRPQESGGARFEILSLVSAPDGADEKWALHAAGLVRSDAGAAMEPEPTLLSALRKRCVTPVAVEDYYQQLNGAGLAFGPRFRGLDALWAGENECLARIRLPEPLNVEMGEYRVHPVMLDSMFQALGGASAEGVEHGIFIPVGLDRLRWLGTPGAEMWSHGVLRSGDAAVSDMVTVDVRLFDESGRPVVVVEGLRLKRASREALMRITQKSLADWLYEVRWQPRPLTTLAQPAAQLPAPQALAGEVESLLAALTVEHGLSIYADLIVKMDSLSVAYVLEAMQSLGFAPAVGDRFSTDELADKLRVATIHRRLFASMLRMLASSGLLRVTDAGWEVRRRPAATNAQATWSKLMADFPTCNAELGLLGRCASRLADVLRGKCDSLDLLFPNGSVSHLEQVYEGSPFAKTSNRLVGELLGRAMAATPADRTLRVLEIGAGTGGTTTCALEHLSPDRTEYVFSDVSPLFLAHARQKFADRPFVRHELLDIERDPASQGFDRQRFDVVLAVNVLHATRDLRQTLTNVRQLLAPGGMLILVETTARMAWADLIFGLTEGWWRFADTDLRPDHALLTRRQWLTLLAEAGLTDPTAVGGAGREDEKFEQSLLVAHNSTTPTVTGRPGHWLILADRDGVGAALADRLTADGSTCTLVHPGQTYAPANGRPWQMNPAKAGHFQRLLQDLHGAGHTEFAGIVHLWSLDTPAPDELTPALLDAAQVLSCGTALHLVQALAKRADAVGRLWLVTRGAQPVEIEPTDLAVAQASLWGLARVIAREHPNFRCTRVDLDPWSESDASAQSLLAEIAADDSEDQVGFRGGDRHVARLVRSEADARRSKHELALPADEPFRLEMDSYGVLDNLRFVPVARRAPGLGEIEIRVVATGLNFLDVLTALDMCPTDPGPLGGECAGRVVAVGEGVTSFQVGDEVLALAPASFSMYVTTNAHMAVPKPAGLSPEEAVTIPTTFWTAYYGLHHFGRMAAGDKVLIHAAAGGVGLAAVQLARHAGAEIYATAGSPRKRRFLKSLGIQHVMDSRSLDFADEIMRLTNRRGVDIVLNSLAGEFITRSMAVLAPNGRFVEIGKADIWDEARIATLKNGISYDVVYLDRMAVAEPEVVGRYMRKVMALVADGSLKPLPVRVYPITQVIEAFRYMAQARHIGKIVMTQDPERCQPAARLPDALRSDATYLITGGLTGLGLVFARWMVDRGARHIVLMGRRSASDEAKAAIAELQRDGAEVRVLRGDVTRGEDVERIFAEIESAMPPLRGIMHSAGVLDDGVLVNQSWDRFAKVLGPKVRGAWHLHTRTMDTPLDFFILFSSAAALLGSVAQGNHAAANAFLDGLAHARRGRGRCGLSINWGPWAQTGAATKVGDDEVRKWKAQGFGTISIDNGVAAFDELLRSDPVQTAVLPVDWAQFVRHFPAGVEPRMFTDLVGQARQAIRHEKPTETYDAFRQKLASASDGEQRNVLLLGYVQEQTAKVLGLDLSRAPDPGQHLSELGLDSLMAVELKNSLERGVGHSLPTTLVFDYPTISELATYLSSQAPADGATEPQPLQLAHHGTPLPEDVDGLSDDQVDAMLDHMLKDENATE
ncbi:MAG: SDR family NAD(P)-dependent oxidoreductase [Phycisphaerae bacterium]|nr:SDR family NAD(P)-dependent oxidoreductase [Phycisphaerae bacterium]